MSPITPQITQAARQIAPAGPEPISPEVALTSKRLGEPAVTGSDMDQGPQIETRPDEPQEEQPFEKEARLAGLSANRDKEIAKAQKWQGIGENLDKIGRSIPGLTGKVDIDKMPKSDLSGLQKATAAAEDKLSGEEVGLLEQYGIKVTPGMSRSQMNNLFPSIVSLKKGEQQANSSEAARAQSQARFETSQANQDRRAMESREGQLGSKAESLGFRKENLKNTIADRFTKYGPAIEVEKNNNAADSALEQLQSGDVNRQRLALNTLVRLSGDTRLSDEDRRQIQLPMGGIERIQAQFERGALNKFNPEMLAGLTKVAESYKARVPKIKDRYAREFAHRNANEFLSDKEIYGQLSGQYEGPAADGEPAEVKLPPDREAAYQKALAEWEAKNAGQKR